MSSKPTFETFRMAVNKAKKVVPFKGRLLALDPGETTGWSMFSATAEKVSLTEQGQICTWPQKDMVENLTKLIDHHQPDLIVHEVYAVYEWKADSHSWSQVPTLHVIGCLETLCHQKGIPYLWQTAQIAKNFCTDDRLKEWGFYIKGQRHARDSIRHGTYYLMFGQSGQSDKTTGP